MAVVTVVFSAAVIEREVRLIEMMLGDDEGDCVVVEGCWRKENVCDSSVREKGSVCCVPLQR